MTKLKNIAVALAAIIIFTNITHAQVSKAKYSVNYEVPLKVKYLGNDSNHLTFQVTVLSQIPDNAFLVITEKYEGVVYTSFFTPTFKVQNVKIKKGDDQELNFKLVIGKQTYWKSFFVNTSNAKKITIAERGITML